MVMTQLQVKKWGNSQAFRFPSNMLKTLGIENDDLLDVEVKNESIIIKKQKIYKELTIEELFENYNGSKFQAEIKELESTGGELW